MKRNQENNQLQQILEWVAEWWGTSVEDCPYSREDIRNICRGPMKDVLLSFLLPRFRTDEQIKVIRSNMFWHDVANKDVTPKELVPFNKLEDELKEIKRKLDKIDEDKLKRVQETHKSFKSIDESKIAVLSNLTDLVTNFEKTESRSQLVQNRVASTGLLLNELYSTKPVPSTGSSIERVRNGTHQDSEAGEIDSSPLQLEQPQLKSLYNNAVDLFDLHLLPSPNANNSQLNLSSEIQGLMSTISAQTLDLAQSGISPLSIERWAKNDQDTAINQVRNVSNKFSNVMNPLEELQNETEALYIKLMTAHLDLHMNNKEFKEKVLDLEKANRIKFEDIILHDGKVLPEDLLRQIHKQENSKKLAKCRELIKELKDLERLCQNSNECDGLLAALCGDLANIEQRRNSGIGERNFRTSFGSIDGNGSFNLAKQETLEDLTCGLLKSFGHSRNQLENTLEQCKNLVLEKFPKVFYNDKADKHRKLLDSSVSSSFGETSTNAAHCKVLEAMQVPKQFLPHYDLITDSVLNAQDDELLGEVFRMQNDIESKRILNEKIFMERASVLNKNQEF